MTIMMTMTMMMMGWMLCEMMVKSLLSYLIFTLDLEGYIYERRRREDISKELFFFSVQISGYIPYPPFPSRARERPKKKNTHTHTHIIDRGRKDPFRSHRLEDFKIPQVYPSTPSRNSTGCIHLFLFSFLSPHDRNTMQQLSFGPENNASFLHHPTP